MPDAIWIERSEELAPLAAQLAAARWIGLDTEFLREKTFFPKLCLLQLAAGGRIWCIDTLSGASLAPLVPALTAAGSRKVIHAARQDLEAFYLTTRRIIAPVFDTQIAAACIGLKPQVGYAELVKLLLDVTLAKGQTRTDWSKRPLSRDQLDYAAEDVLYLEDLACRLVERLRVLGREHWVAEDCAALEEPRLFEPDPAFAWTRLRGLAQLAPQTRTRAKTIAIWREKTARERDLPRSWVVSDAGIVDAAQRNPDSVAALRALREIPPTLNEGFARGLLEVLHAPPDPSLVDDAPGQDLRPTPQQRALIERLNAVVDARAAALDISPEVLAPRGEIKALALGRRDTPALAGWRRTEIGETLLQRLD
jgi:ribonuclease D